MLNTQEEIELLPPCPDENIIYINKQTHNCAQVVIILLLVLILLLLTILSLINILAHKAHVEIILENLKTPISYLQNFTSNN
jgi:hypothetical protein